MPSSNTLNQQIVSHARGQKRIDLRAALETSSSPQVNHHLTFGELAPAYLATHYNGADMQMRKWIDLLGERSAWTITPDELSRAGVAMRVAWLPHSLIRSELSQGQLVAATASDAPVKLEIRLYRQKYAMSPLAEQVWLAVQK